MCEDDKEAEKGDEMVQNFSKSSVPVLKTASLLLLLLSHLLLLLHLFQVPQLLCHQVQPHWRDPGPVGGPALPRRQPEPPGAGPGGDGTPRQPGSHRWRALTGPLGPRHGRGNEEEQEEDEEEKQEMFSVSTPSSKLL